MRILDKYILKELLGPFVFGIAAFSSIFIGTNTLFKIAQYITQYGASISSVVKLFFLSLPSILVLTFPMSMLLGSLMAFGRLSGSSEITAMKSGGVSFYRLAAPVLIFAFVVSMFTIVINEKVVPASNTAYNRIVTQDIKKDFNPVSQEHIVIKDVAKDEYQRILYARSFNQKTATMTNVTIQEIENDKVVRIETAQKAVWDQNQWIMYDGIINDMSVEGKIERTLRFKEQVLPINKDPENISKEQKKREEMTIKELKQQIKILQMEKISSGKYEVELHQRVSIPLTCFIFALIGSPLGLAPNRSSSSIGLGVSVVIIFIYYTMMTIFGTLGQSERIAPALAAWLPDIVAMTVGVYLMKRASH
ncbi:LptF/LptG family permease [Selenomonadales bacterium OttesenSCG-928-I06]|nr:LptF/LptG family permease [Selenomonadales bacterium OttesenSCG-928-I06]